MTAVDEDGILQRNPCRIRGAQDERPAERPVLTVPQVFALADAMADRRFRALVLLVTFASLRWGEVTALRRRDLDLDRGPSTCVPRSWNGRTGSWSSAHPSPRPGCAR